LTSSDKRGVTLIEMLVLVPLLGAMLTIGFRLISQTVRMQKAESRLLSDDAVMHDVIRRLQADADQAQRARLSREDSQATVRLEKDGNSVIYQFAGKRVMRSEQTNGVVTASYSWVLECSTADAMHESIGTSPGVVWVLFKLSIPVTGGRGPDRIMSAAAAVGQRGAS